MIYENRYGRIDRLLHRLAFSARIAQRALADVEDLLHEETLDSIELRAPVLITALPRSGTTILLNLLAETNHFATHVYWDMPFVLCPMLWARFSRPFRRNDGGRERAHGDGLRISGESPEAFEEMVWKEFWPSHYLDDRVVPWTPSDRSPTFDAFLGRHMRKIVALRREAATDERRYLSKNNLNVARLAAPPPAFQRGCWLVLFRDPVQQAASMLEQHRRFTRIHEEDDFVRRYMEAIGHYEFGKELRPIDFDGWVAEATDPMGLEFWLRYWTAAYSYVLEHRGSSTRLVSYAALTRGSRRSLGLLAHLIEIPTSDLVHQCDRLHRPRSRDVDTSTVRGRVLEEALELHGELECEANVT